MLRLPTLAVGGQVDAASDERGLCLPVHPRKADRAGNAPARLPPEKDVFRDGELGKEAQLLMNERDPFAAGVGGACDVDAAPLDRDRAFVIVEKAREHAHQRRLARAVLADQAMNLGPVQIEVYPVDRARGPEAHRDGAERNHTLAGMRRGADGMETKNSPCFAPSVAGRWEPRERLVQRCLIQTETLPMDRERPKVGPSRPFVPEVRGAASGGLHDPGGWGGEAQSAVGEACCWADRRRSWQRSSEPLFRPLGERMPLARLRKAGKMLAEMPKAEGRHARLS